MKRKKPDFSPNFSWWSDPNFLPMALVDELKVPLVRCKQITPEQATAFLEACAERVQEAVMRRDLVIKGNAETRDEIALIAEKVRALLRLLENISPAAKGALVPTHSELMLVSKPAVYLKARSPFTQFTDDSDSLSTIEDRLGGQRRALSRSPIGADFISSLWDQLADLEATADYASSKINPGKQSKPTLVLARALVYDIAGEYMRISRKLPPYSKGTWFPEFMEILGNWPDLRLPCGRELIEKVVKERLSPG